MNEVAFGDRLKGLKYRINGLPRGIKRGIGLAAALTALLSGCSSDSSATKPVTPPTGMDGEPKPTNVAHAPEGFMEHIGNNSNVYEVPTQTDSPPEIKPTQTLTPEPEATPKTITIHVDSQPEASNVKVVTVTPSSPTQTDKSIKVITIQSGNGVGGSTEANPQSPRVRTITATPSPKAPSVAPTATAEAENPVNTRVITVQSGSSGETGNNTQASQPSSTEGQNSTDNTEKSRWTETKWEPNQTIPLSEWWNDMINQGYIRLDSLAEQYAGDKIRSMLNTLDLVPNPKNYWEKQLAFVGSCTSELQS